MSYTYTYAILEVSAATYAEIRAKLRAAGYSEQFHRSMGSTDEVIDMHGIALQQEAQETSNDRSSSPDQ